MKNWFKKSAAAPISAAEKALQEWNVRYRKQPDGSIFVPGNLDIAMKGLTSLPDLRKVKVGGEFDCHGNQLTSLKGAPQSVGGHFACGGNQLITLEGAPQSFNGHFHCGGNQLMSLKGAPQSVDGGFWCHDNRLTSLEGAPQSFINLQSDFGEFGSWQEVPEALRLSPETKSRQQEAAIQAATVLSAPLTVKGPLRLKIK